MARLPPLEFSCTAECRDAIVLSPLLVTSAEEIALAARMLGQAFEG